MNKGSERRDIEYVMRENKILKEENEVLRQQVLNNTDLENTISQVLTLQRERIRNLEIEYDALYGKYEDVLNSKPVSAEETIQELLNKDMGTLKAKAEHEGMEDLVKQHAKEMSQMKARMTEQGAKMLLQKDDRYLALSIFMFYYYGVED